MRRGALENKHPIVMNVCIGLASGFAGFRIQPHRYHIFLQSNDVIYFPSLGGILEKT
jgi:hypothetical protein